MNLLRKSTFLSFVAFAAWALQAQDLSKESQACIACHDKMNHSLVLQWKESQHAKNDIGCFECHTANKGEKDAMDHYGQVISAIVSPKDCARCHLQEATEMTESYHATANKFTGSLDNVLGRIVTGEANFNLGCASCHGSTVEVDKTGHPIAPTWPNNGIGRINPDGSHGSCTGCHNRHTFEVEQARTPETCGKCHQGPDHPQIEIYTLSKHGIQFNISKGKMNLGKHGPWVLGEDYYQAPNCVTCHMGATSNGLKSTHNVGARLKWTLRPVISTVLPAEPQNKLGDGNVRREDMKKVCLNCHAKQWGDQFFTMFDEYVELYNDKFAAPAQSIVNWLQDNKVIDASPFNDQVEWDFWHLWHHEGRRGRHGAAMMAPDWSHWHGMYEVAYNFYFHLIPHADKAVETAVKKGIKVQEEWNKFKNSIIDQKEHKWIKGLSKEDREDIVKFYKDRYGKEVQQKK